MLFESTEIFVLYISAITHKTEQTELKTQTNTQHMHHTIYKNNIQVYKTENISNIHKCTQVLSPCYNIL